MPSGRSTNVTFYIVERPVSADTNTALLGMPAIRSLDLIPDLSGRVNEVSVRKTAEAVVQSYPDVFEGLSKFSKPLKLELKESAVPRATPPRQVPQGVRAKLKLELGRLEQQGVEKVFVTFPN